jgi:YHS domain-containing protein
MQVDRRNAAARSEYNGKELLFLFRPARPFDEHPNATRGAGAGDDGS